MYRAAVIGLGRMGSTFDDEIQRGGAIFLPYCHAPSYVASPHTELVAGADLHEGQGAIFAERWGLSGEHIYSDYRDMLAAERPDIVSVCTTARHRAAIMQDAIEAGVKAIWAEKPITLSLAEADTVIDLSTRKGVVIAVNCSRRHSPFLSEARRMVQDGELGEILQITAYAECYISHNGSHAIDTIRYLVGGDVEWVFGEMESDEQAAADEDLRGNGYLAFDNGVRCFLRAMPTGIAPWEFDVIGTEGRVRSLSNGAETQYYRWVPGGLRDEGLPARARPFHCPPASRAPAFPSLPTLSRPSKPVRTRAARQKTAAKRSRSQSRCASRTARAAAASTCRSPTVPCRFCRSKSAGMPCPPVYADCKVSPWSHSKKRLAARSIEES